MQKNPKMIAGVTALAVMIILGAVLVTQIPQMPDTVWAEVINAGEPTPEPALSNGSQGEKVEELQKRLQALGYYTGEIDGQFGPGTREAVVAFQKNNGLDADGLAGTETLGVLYSQNARSAQQ